jgi:hypothetical protein
VLTRFNIRTLGLPPGKFATFIWLVKDDFGFKTPSVYRLFRKHHRHNTLYHPDKSAVAEHGINLGHRIRFQETRILATISRYMERIIREAIQIELLPDTMKRGRRFLPEQVWAFPTIKRELRGKKFRGDQMSAVRFREMGGAL